MAATPRPPMLARIFDPLLKMLRHYRRRNTIQDPSQKVPHSLQVQPAFDKPGKALLVKLAAQHPELRKAMIKAAKKSSGPGTLLVTSALAVADLTPRTQEV